MRVHVRTRNRMHQSAIVLVRCVPGSFSFRRHIGEDPGDEVALIPTFRLRAVSLLLENPYFFARKSVRKIPLILSTDFRAKERLLAV